MIESVVLTVVGVALSLAGVWDKAVPSAVAASPEVWIGSPVRGNWPTKDECAGAQYPSRNCSWPTVHHTYRWGKIRTGDWGVDLKAAAGSEVRLYAAPQDDSREVYARIDNVVLACSSGKEEDGGHSVVVGIYEDGQYRRMVGQVSFTHIVPAPGIRAGAVVPRWNHVLGNIGSYRRGGCWNGAHLHLEMVSSSGFACFNKGYTENHRIDRTNFIGFIGGNVAGKPRQRCR